METIMIQEADPAILDVVTTALQMQGYRVCSLTDDKENILEMIRRHRPKLVLMDCWLNHYSGRQISHWIKSHFPGLPVVAFSCDNQIDQHYRRLGYDDYIKKPFNLSHLYGTVRKYLTGSTKQRPAAIST
jgi:DNA-binding response OmpR family regulator